MTRLEELEEILEKVCSQYEANCDRCPKRKECNEYLNLLTAFLFRCIADGIQDRYP